MSRSRAAFEAELYEEGAYHRKMFLLREAHPFQTFRKLFKRTFEHDVPFLEFFANHFNNRSINNSYSKYFVPL